MGDGFQLHDGKFLVAAGGFAVHKDCCCADHCLNCEAGGTPYQWDILFSALAKCCVAAGAGKSRKVTTTPVGPYRLTQDPGIPCLWSLTLPDVFVVQEFNDETCTGAVIDTLDAILEIDLRRLLGFFKLSAYLYISGWSTKIAGQFFEEDDYFVTPCRQVAAFTNQWPFTYCHGQIFLIDGTATATPV